MSIKDLISDALFNCYHGYNAETIADLRMRSMYERNAQAERVLQYLDANGYEVVRKKTEK